MRANSFLLRSVTAFSLLAVLVGLWCFFPEKAMFFLVSVCVAILIWEYYQLITLVFTWRSFVTFFVLVFGAYLFFASSMFAGFLSGPVSLSGPVGQDNPGEQISFLKNIFLLEWLALVTYLLWVMGVWIFYLRKKDAIEVQLKSYQVSTSPRASKESLNKKSFLPGFLPKLPKKSFLIFSPLALLYIAFPATMFLNMFFRDSRSKAFLICFLFIVFAGDIFAYLGGKLFKGKKWTPALSPGKTWSGLFCGLSAGGVAGAFGICFIQGFAFSLFCSAFLFATLAFFIAQTGDLFVSFLKRRAGVKNTSALLPGHGGLLDRLDGFLLAFPSMYFAFKIFGFI